MNDAKQMLDMMEEMLGQGGGAFLAGESYSLADIIGTVFLSRCNWEPEVRAKIQSLPRVSKYYAVLKSRPCN